MNTQLSGIILAGGKSRRMGVDKGTMMFKGKPFIKHVIEAVKPLVDEVVIVSNDGAYDVFMETTRVNDEIKNAGPLAGIYSGLRYIKTPYAVVLSCDIPKISKKVLQLLIQNMSADDDIIQLKGKEGTMPLIAIYKKECWATCFTLLKAGKRRVKALVGQLKVKTVSIPEQYEPYLANINTPEELTLATYEIDH